MQKLFIEGKRTGYAPEQCGETLTAKQLANAILNQIEWGNLDPDAPVYLCNDNGYTYGEINDYDSLCIGEDADSRKRMYVQTERGE